LASASIGAKQMAKDMFNFETEFKLGIETVDHEHMKLVNMLNSVYTLVNECKKTEAIEYFSLTLARYVIDHFAHEEAFMQKIGYPQLEEHAKVHENFKKSFMQTLPRLANYDDAAFRAALTDTFTWIINHIGRTDRRYALYYQSLSQPQKS
jgi:hemerythrin